MSETRKVYIGRLIGRCDFCDLSVHVSVPAGFLHGSEWDEFFQRVFPSAPFVGCVGGRHDPSDHPHQK